MDADAEVLIKKGKKFAAVFLHEKCRREEENSNVLNGVLDYLLDPTKSIDSWDTIDWCRWIMSGGKTPDEFAQTVRRYDNATTCGLVWTANFVAYRCRTCGISPCMSLCAECFLRGNHEGHDFNMFRSQAGGACDCGDTSVMKETGFCQKHGPQAQLSKPQPPPDLVCVAEMMMPRIILRLIQHLREHSCNVRDFAAIQEADGFLTMLHQLSELGGAMRKVMTHALSNPVMYNNLAVDCTSPNKDKEALLQRSYGLYEQAKSRLTNIPEHFLDIESLQPELKHKTFLEELVFWTVKFEFPQKLVCFLLNMLTDPDYKVAFTQTFVQHYSRISVMLAQSTTSDTLSNRVVHVSVQLFSNEDLTFRMTQEYKLLHIMVISIQSMMSRILVKNTLQDLDKNFHYVVDCSHSIMKEHCYWPLVSDLNNVLTHKPVALEFLKDCSLLEMWFSFLLMFQGMNVNLRELRQHVEFESNTYYAAFLAELEASATPMWALISHLKDSDTVHLTKQVITLCLSSLEDWFDAIVFSPLDFPNPYQVSFHLPLHRHLALFLSQALTQQDIDLTELLPNKETLQMIMMHPLQAQVAFHEIMNGLWVRNGVQIKGQAMTYIQCHFCNSMVDPDLFLLQLCASQLEPNWFIKTVFQRFQVWDWLSFDPCKNFTYLEPDHLIPMLEASLTFLATLVDIRTSLGLTEEEITKMEMISLLCMSDRTHSQLMDLLPEKCGTTSQSKDFESILSKIADYKAPNFEAGGNMLQGIYVPKAEIWEQEYDPIHVMLRAVHRRDFQTSVDRYTLFVRQAGKFKGTGLPWLPYRVPRSPFKSIDPCKILQCETFHAVMFTILYRAFQDPSVPEHIYSLCIYLLELAVRFSPQTVVQKEPMRPMEDDVPDLNYQDWYPSNWTLQNILLPIRRVVIPPQSEMSTGLVEEMEIDDEYEEANIMETTDNGGYQVQSPLVEDSIEGNSQPSLPNINVPLALPSSSTPTSGELVLANSTVVATQTALTAANTEYVSSTSSSSSDSSVASDNQQAGSYDMVLTPPQQSYIHTNSQTPPLPTTAHSSGGTTSTTENMAIVPTPVGPATLRPRSLKLRHIRGRHNVMLTNSGIFLRVSCNEMPKALPYVLASVEVNESILSVLLRLHSKFSGKPDSYKPKSERTSVSANPDDPTEIRIGDGSFYIGQLLDRIVQMNVVSGEAMVQEVRQRLWPRQDSDMKEQTGLDGKGMDKEEKRRKARERQQKLMAEFASRQKAFMEQTMTSEGQDQGGEHGSREAQTIIREYECIICGQTTPSTLAKPIGMVVLVQATSVLGHMHQDEEDKRRLPCSDDDKQQLRKDGQLGTYMKQRVEQMARFFDGCSWQVAVNIGWEGGVHIQSCGHYVHMDCHKSYTESLRSQQSQRHQNLAVERGEYFCPLCRQLANSVLPVNPDMGETVALVKCHPHNLTGVAQELVQLFSTSPVPVSPILKKMADIMEDLTVTTYPQYRSFCSPDSHSLYLFVCSIARTNLEVELLRKRMSANPSSKKNCFVPLFHVLACHAKVLTRAPLLQWWSQLTGLPVDDHLTSLTPLEQEVPAFLRDVSAALIQIILTLPLNIDKAYYHCVVQILYNLAYVQALAQLSCQLNLQQRLRFKDRVRSGDAQLNTLGGILGTIIDHLEHSALYVDDEDLDAALKEKEWTEEELELNVQTLCLPFMRVAALLESHLYNDELPNTKNSVEEFQILARHLSLPGQENASISRLAWATSEPLLLIGTWCQDMINFVNRSLITARTLLGRPLQWHPPALLKLPENYNEIFQYYHRRPCLVCHSIPKDPSMCLVCGTMVCLRENCCRQQSLSEAVTHSISCGAGTAIFLAVNSSTIVVIRGKRACLWGSVYLDKFGEEDRDLKRGKPLYLSHDRYKLLQDQWLNHSFDHTNKRWVWHRDNL